MICRSNRRRGFSLLELVIVVVIMGIVAAVAIPRISRGTAGASDSALAANLSVLRNAINMYEGEHPGLHPTVANIEEQLTKFTDIFGAVSDTKTATHIYGPYIRRIPSLPVGAAKGNSVIAADSGDGVGWKYYPVTGEIQANTSGSEKDSADRLYNDY
jgi:prepilin-type N-terminal cleavage/methylation domain-containing protein